MGRKIPEAHRLGGGEYRGDLDLLPPAAGTQKTHEVDQHAGTPQRGDQAAHLRRPNLPQCGELLVLTVERHEAWLEDHRYLNRDLLKEHKKEAPRQAA